MTERWCKTTAIEWSSSGCVLLAARGAIISGDAQAALGLDAAGMRPLLKRLVDEGLAAVEGKKRGTQYRKV